MKNTKIEWCDSTWNPITGCLHGCEYCYASKQSKRFIGCMGNEEFISKTVNGVQIYELSQQMHRKTKKGEIIKAAYPFGFAPTFHRYRLDEPQKMKKPKTIFVGSMCDLFGDWIPDEWIQKVFKACEAAPQHRYLFLTKNPARLREIFWYKKLAKNRENYFFGTSVTDEYNLFNAAEISALANSFLSIEPLHSEIDFNCDWEINGEELENPLSIIRWVIIGAETGNRKNKIVPKLEWIENIVSACKESNVPVFMKNSLSEIWGEPLIQEYPW